MSAPINSGDWRIVNEYASKRIHSFQKSLERVDQDPVSTAVLRGRIAELRALQAWGSSTNEEVSGLS